MEWCLGIIELFEEVILFFILVKIFNGYYLDFFFFEIVGFIMFYLKRGKLKKLELYFKVRIWENEDFYF